MKFFYVAIVFMTLSHNYKCIDQTLEEIGAVMRGLLTSGFIDDPDCGTDENSLEDYFSKLFPNLMCDYLGMEDSLSSSILVFECLGGLRYLVVSYNSMYIQICLNDNENYESDLKLALLDKDEFDNLGFTFEDVPLNCNYVFVMMRCLIYQQCEAYDVNYCVS